MRVIRTILGILLLAIGLPLLLAGGGLWTAMQHRDAGGAFSGDLEEIKTPGYAVVVPDVDGLLRSQAPFARGEQTRLRVTAQTAVGAAFIGMAPPADAARYLAGVAHTRIDEVKLARGALPVRAVPITGAAPATGPRQQRFWVRSGIDALEWNPSATRGRQLALVVMAANGERPGAVSASTELRVGWLNSSTWGLLVLGSVMLLLGIIFLGWPARAREVVYVVDPSQLPDIAARLGVPVPSLVGVGGPPQAGSRPATLAESVAVEPVAAPWTGTALPPVAPKLAWPPVPATVRSQPGVGAEISADGLVEPEYRQQGVRADDYRVERAVDADRSSAGTAAAALAGSRIDSLAVASAVDPAGTSLPVLESAGDAPSVGAGQPNSVAGGQAEVPVGTGPAGNDPAAGGAATAFASPADSAPAADAGKRASAPAKAGQNAGAATSAPAKPRTAKTAPVEPGDANRATAGLAVAEPGAVEPAPAVVVPPPVVPARAARRRRANAAPEQASGASDTGGRRTAPAARSEGQPEMSPGAGIAAAVAAGGRRPGRPRGSTKAKPAKSEADQPVA